MTWSWSNNQTLLFIINIILFLFTAVIFSKVKLWETIYFLLIPLFKHELNIIAQHVFFPDKINTVKQTDDK